MFKLLCVTVLLLTIVFPVFASNDFAVGFRKMEVTSNETNTHFPMAVVYPTHVPTKPVKFGSFQMELSIDAAIAEGSFPLVVISHGSGGSNIAHRSIAFALVKQGFIVAMPLHPENNYINNSAQGSLNNWITRPLHLKSAIDDLLLSAELSVSIDADRIAIVGHSVGGYTALALAGGTANTGHIIKLCESVPELNASFCGPVKDNKLMPAEILNQRDTRIKAIVLMAPLGILFKSDDALVDVNIPTLLLRAEKDTELTEPYHSEVIARNFNSKPMLSYQIIKNAGHFSFITPFPDAIKSDVGLAAQDPEGFDRYAFHQVLGAQIVNYLNLVLNR